MSNIESIRTEIKNAFEQNLFTAADFETFVSPTNNFRLTTTNYWHEKPNWDITRAEIYEQNDNKKIFDFFGNDGHFFHAWVQKNNIEYLICAEDIFGGQTIIDVSNKIMASYSPGEDGFIWTDFYLSPDGNNLATIGCYWACPYIIKIFDFTNPLSLPLPEINTIRLIGNDEVITGWANNETIKTKGIKREYEIEFFDNGSFRNKIISETPAERNISILEFQPE